MNEAAYKNRRTVVTLDGVARLAVQVRCCRAPGCPRLGVLPRLEHEGRVALPESDFGLGVIALVGRLRHAGHRSVPEIHTELVRGGVPICVRSVGNLQDRYDELLALAPRGTSHRTCGGPPARGSSPPPVSTSVLGLMPAIPARAAMVYDDATVPAPGVRAPI